MTTVFFTIHWHSEDDDRMHKQCRMLNTPIASAAATFIRLGGADAADAAHVATQTGSEFFAHDEGLEKGEGGFAVVSCLAQGGLVVDCYCEASFGMRERE
jgi:hypothetical protein